MECVEKTRAVAKAIEAHDYETAMDLRGSSFREAFETLNHAARPAASTSPEQKRFRLAVMHAGVARPRDERRGARRRAHRPGSRPYHAGDS